MRKITYKCVSNPRVLNNGLILFEKIILMVCICIILCLILFFISTFYNIENQIKIQQIKHDSVFDLIYFLKQAIYLNGGIVIKIKKFVIEFILYSTLIGFIPLFKNTFNFGYFMGNFFLRLLFPDYCTSYWF